MKEKQKTLFNRSLPSPFRRGAGGEVILK